LAWRFSTAAACPLDHTPGQEQNGLRFVVPITKKNGRFTSFSNGLAFMIAMLFITTVVLPPLRFLLHSPPRNFLFHLAHKQRIAPSRKIGVIKGVLMPGLPAVVKRHVGFKLERERPGPSRREPRQDFVPQALLSRPARSFADWIRIRQKRYICRRRRISSRTA